jgi:hypothetical protein
MNARSCLDKRSNQELRPRGVGFCSRSERSPRGLMRPAKRASIYRPRLRLEPPTPLRFALSGRRRTSPPHPCPGRARNIQNPVPTAAKPKRVGSKASTIMRRSRHHRVPIEQITIQIAPITIKRMPIMRILFSTSEPSYGRYDLKERMPILKLDSSQHRGINILRLCSPAC